MKIGATEECRDLPMWRWSDPDTSRAAAERVSPHLTALQARVLAQIVLHGPITPKEIEALPVLADLGFSTSRRRCSELLALGKVRRVGVRDGSMLLEKVR